MKFDILYNFISPITGRVLSDRDYMLIGDRNNIATPSPLFMDVKIDIQNIQQAIKNIPIEVNGAINLKGKLSSFFLDTPNVLTSTFEPNPVFTGDSLHLPYGPTSTRPIYPKEGMFRYNDEIGYLEYFNGIDWASLTSSVQPINISKEFATDMVYGVIGSVNGLFDGFSSLERNLDIKIKSSYYTGKLNDSSSASLSLLDRYDNGYINKTTSSNNGFFDYLLQQQDGGLKVDLLKFDNKIDEFIFHKPISYNGKNIIKYDEAVDIVTGVLNNSNSLFAGYSSEEQEVNIKIKSSHFATNDYSSSSLSFLDRYDQGYFFKNTTNSDWSNDFTLNTINSGLETELLKYIGGSVGKFVFNRFVEVPYPVVDYDAANKLYVDSTGVKEVLGTSGEINVTFGAYPQVSLADTGAASGVYSLANINVDSKGRIVSASDGQAVTSITGGYGIDGGTITDTGTLSLSNSGVIAGIYTRANINVDSKGRIVSASDGGGVFSVTAGTGLTGGTITGSGTIGLNYTGVYSGTYYNPTLTVGSDGRISYINDGTAVSVVNTGYGLTGGPITNSGTISLANSGVNSGSYTNANITVDNAGRITSASNGQSSSLGNFQFNGDTMHTSGYDMYISNLNVNFSGSITTGGGVGMSGFGAYGFIWVSSDGSLRYTGPNGTTKLAN